MAELDTFDLDWLNNSTTGLPITARPVYELFPAGGNESLSIGTSITFEDAGLITAIRVNATVSANAPFGGAFPQLYMVEFGTNAAVTLNFADAGGGVYTLTGTIPLETPLEFTSEGWRVALSANTPGGSRPIEFLIEELVLLINAVPEPPLLNSIMFGELPTIHGDSEGGGTVTMRVTGIDAAAVAGLSFGGGRMTMRLAAYDEGDAGEIVIIVPDYAVMGMSLGGAGEDASHVGDDGGLRQQMRQRGYDLIDQQDAGIGEFTMRLRATEYVEPTAYGFFVEQDGQITAYGGIAYETMTSGLAFGDDSEADITVVLQSLINLRSNISWVNRLHMTLTSSLTARAAFDVVFEATLEDSLAFADDPEMVLTMVLALADRLDLTGETQYFSDALITFVSALVLGDAFAPGQDMTLESLLEMVDQLTEEIDAVMALVSELEFSDESSGNATIAFVVSDTFVLTDELGSGLAALVELADTIGFTARFSLPGYDNALYVGYAMNLRNAGMVKYDNYPFSAMDTVGGVPLAVGPEGLYRLEGDDDDGLPIRARIRTGLTDFDTNLLKRTLNSYLGYTTDGQLVMKVTTTDGGKKREHWYKLGPRTADSPVDGRFDIAKGLVGMYWGYELVNVDGADFEADVVRVWPFIVQRRQSGR